LGIEGSAGDAKLVPWCREEVHRLTAEKMQIIFEFFSARGMCPKRLNRREKLSAFVTSVAKTMA
jgi:hypothetical protein